MSEDAFDKLIKEKVYNFSDPEEKGDWEALSARMAKHAAMRRKKMIWYTSAAACLLLLLTLFTPVLHRSPVPQPGAIAIIPPILPDLNQPDPMDIRTSKVPRISEVIFMPSRKKMAATLSQNTEESQVPVPSVIQPETPQQEDNPVFAEVKPAPQEKTDNRSSFIMPDLPARKHLNNKWITAANFSYQGAINGSFLFTPSTYTSQWETPLSLAGSDLSNLGIPDYLANQFTEDDVNVISTHFSTPLSVGINVQKEFNRWLSVGASFTYTLLRGEYQVHTADKSYIVDQNTHYIGIPVGIYFHAVNNRYLSVYAVGGGAVDKAVSDEYICQLNNVSTRQSQAVEGVQWSVFGGLGIEYKCSDLIGIYLEPTVSHYFDNDQPKSIRTIQPTQFKMELGIRFRI